MCPSMIWKWYGNHTSSVSSSSTESTQFNLRYRRRRDFLGWEDTSSVGVFNSLCQRSWIDCISWWMVTHFVAHSTSITGTVSANKTREMRIVFRWLNFLIRLMILVLTVSLHLLQRNASLLMLLRTDYISLIIKD